MTYVCVYRGEREGRLIVWSNECGMVVREEGSGMCSEGRRGDVGRKAEPSSSLFPGQLCPISDI